MAANAVKKNSLLSGREMVRHHTSTYEVRSEFNRLVSLDELDDAKANDLARMKDELRLLLGQERVNKSESISEGVWDNDSERRVRITRMEGKWQQFGYQDSTGKYVESHEALFLMEMNRLMVKWNGVIISIEQGYSLFLGRPHSLTLEEYRVYSVLNRAGYYVLRYEPAREYRADGTEDMPSEEERCVWGNLYEMLHQPNPRADEWGPTGRKANTKLYETVRRSMLKYVNLIKKHSAVNPPEYSSAARGENSGFQTESRKHKLSSENCFNSIERFRRLFDQFDVVCSFTDEEYSSCNQDAPSSTNQSPERERLALVFDLFVPESMSFKKSLPPLPIARILVRNSSQPMPYAKELHEVYNRQKQQVPLMLMLVSEILSVHCYLYDMRQVPRNLITLPTDAESANK